MVTDTTLTDEIFRQPYLNDDPLSWKNVITEPQESEVPVQRFRPYNMESKGFHNITRNQLILSNIDPENFDNDQIKDLLTANQKLADYLSEKDQLQSRRKGRPK